MIADATAHACTQSPTALVVRTCLTLVFCLWATTGNAQQVPVADGVRVRVSAPALPAPLIGRVTRVDRASGVFVVTTPGGDAEITLPLAAVTHIDVSRGQGRRRSGVIGGGVGLLVGGIIGGVQVAREGGDGPGAVAVPLVFGFTGLTFGGLLGLAVSPERWRTVYEHDASAAPIQVVVNQGASVKRFADGTVGVKGERNRRRGILRGALILGGLGLVAGGIDRGQGEIGAGEYIGLVAGNTAIGGFVGYFISPRGWQRLPAPSAGVNAGSR